jgi:hypothetical protein
MVSSGIQTARRQAIAQTQTRAKARTSIETQTQDIPTGRIIPKRPQLETQQLPPISVQRGQRLTTQQLPPISVQSGIRGQGVIATQTPKQLKFNTPPQPRPIPILNQAPPKNIFTEQPRPRPIPILDQPPPPIYRGLLDEPAPIFINPTKTRGVRSDREIRGSQGTADQPFNAEAPTPNILDYEGILMRNAEEDRRLVQRRREEMTERFKSTIKDIGRGIPRDNEEEKEEERPSSPIEVIIFTESDEELTTPREEDIQLDQQIEGVERAIAQEEDVAMAQGRAGFVDDRIEDLQPQSQIEDTPTRGVRRGRRRNADKSKVAQRREYFEERGMTDEANLPYQEVLDYPDDAFDDDKYQSAPSGDIRDYGRYTPGS